MLLAALKTWRRVYTPTLIFHGCRSEDFGVDLSRCTLTGNKWFSADAYYAGEYAWHLSDRGAPVRASVRLRAPAPAIECPVELRGGKFVEFLAGCFPAIPPDYSLSRHFQDSLAQHLLHAFAGSVRAYVSHGGSEILVPACEEWIDVCEFTNLPMTKSEYVALGGLVHR